MLRIALAGMAILWGLAGWGIVMAGEDSQQSSSGAGAATDSALAERLAQAAIVISGTVTNTAPLPERPPFMSTHGPDWWQATISVESVEKGKVPAKSIEVLFAHSDDIAWYRSPKLAKGEQAVWILHNKDPYGKATPGPAVVDPMDVRPIENLAKVRDLLKSGNKSAK
jgi:hypothetical protein